MKKTRKTILWTGLVVLVVVALGVTFWHRRFQNYTPAEAVLDLRAAAMARNASRPVDQFMELRYGPLTEPANRQKAFLDFFNIGHIEGLQLIVSRAPAGRREESIAAMAQWVADYRRSLSPAERQNLNTYLSSDAGRATLEGATSKYLSQDVYYRAATAPVIAQLMATLAEVRKP